MCVSTRPYLNENVAMMIALHYLPCCTQTYYEYEIIRHQSAFIPLWCTALSCLLLLVVIVIAVAGASYEFVNIPAYVYIATYYITIYVKTKQTESSWQRKSHLRKVCWMVMYYQILFYFLEPNEHYGGCWFFF